MSEQRTLKWNLHWKKYLLIYHYYDNEKSTGFPRMINIVTILSSHPQKMLGEKKMGVIPIKPQGREINFSINVNKMICLFITLHHVKMWFVLYFNHPVHMVISPSNILSIITMPLAIFFQFFPFTMNSKHNCLNARDIFLQKSGRAQRKPRILLERIF